MIDPWLRRGHAGFIGCTMRSNTDDPPQWGMKIEFWLRQWRGLDLGRSWKSLIGPQPMPSPSKRIERKRNTPIGRTMERAFEINCSPLGIQRSECFQHVGNIAPVAHECSDAARP